MAGAKLNFNVVELIDDLFVQAEKYKASDIHFEPGSENMTVKLRLDGVLQNIEQLPAAVSENIITRLKVMASLLTYRNDIPQEGCIENEGQVAGAIEKRISTFPTIYGQRAVVRLFYCDNGLDRLDELGLPASIENSLKRIVARDQGVLLLSGPAGSGKTTTLAALLRYIKETLPGKSIVSLEDPVERRIDGITQVQITENSELTFPRALRSLLRQDPQVLMVGEIRDSETARIVIEAGLSGHFLMSTMHSGSPAGALLRLLEMGIEPYQVTSAVGAVLNQRLIRKYCPECRRKTDSGYEPVGCSSCLNTGFKGRTLAAELVEMDSDLRKAVLNHSDLEQISSVVSQHGHVTLDQQILKMVREGIIEHRSF